MLKMKVKMAAAFRLALLLAALMTAVAGFSRRNSQLLTNELRTLRTMRRGSNLQCFGAGNKCFSSFQCCQGFVCAAFDDYSGENPDVPGFCVKEKDLQLCVTDEDCLIGQRSVCRPFGLSGQRYCLLKESLRNEISPLTSLPQPRKFSHVYYPGNNGRLGSACEDSSDCYPSTESSVALCCKDVRRARQGVKRMCDRRETPSPCI